MQVKDLIPSAYLKATGEVYSGSSGDSDWLKMLGIANIYQPNWAHEPGAMWASLYSPVEIGTVTATDTFDLDDSIMELSNDADDRVRITHTDGKYTDYQTVSPQKLKAYPLGNYCAKVGQSLVFNTAFVADDKQFGGTITVPAFVSPDKLVKDSDYVAVDNPNWLVLVCAAEWTRTDVTLAQNYPSIIAEANDAMAAMKRANNPQETRVQTSRVWRGKRW